MTLATTWRKGKWTWFNQIRWLGSGVFNHNDDEFTRDVRGIDDWAILNTSIGYSMTEKINIQLNIDNALDKDAPFAAATANAYFSGVLGRYATLTVRGRF